MDSGSGYKLSSRRNRVHRTHDGVVKEFSSPDDFVTEKDVYDRLRGSGLTAELTEYSQGRIVTRFMEGSTLFEAMEAALGDPARQAFLFGAFFSWCRQFYQRTGLILGDTNFRNFILSQDRLYGVDFETCRTGAPAEDLVWQAAMLTTLDPAYAPERMDCTRRFLAQAPENLYGPPEEILGLLPEAYRSICRRRGVPLRDEALRMIGSTLEIAVCILAGGRSSRMGRDKKNLCHRGRSFLRNAMDLLDLYADRYLSLAADDPLDAPEGYRLIKDRFPAKGPAGGITEVLSGTRRPWALFIPCDMPLLTGPLLDELAGRRSEDLDAVMFSEDEEVRTFPLLLRTRTAAPAFGAALKEDRLKLRRILAHPLRVGIVRAESCASYRKGCLDNINTREDYERLDAPTE